MAEHDDPDREAILARRKRFIAHALDDFADSPVTVAGPRTKLMALAISGLTTACPCLDVFLPPKDDSDSGESESESDSESGGGTDGTDSSSESDGTGTG